MFYTYSGTSQINFITILTPSSLDCFGLGALLAFYRIYKNKAFDFKNLLSKSFLLLNILTFILIFFFKNYLFEISLYSKYGYVLNPMLIWFNTGVIFLFIISRASIGFKGILKRILENKMLMYLGRISYGLYLYHNFIPVIYYKLGLPPITNPYGKFFVWFTLLVVVSSISWFLVEKPINGLKKYFKYT